MSLNTSNTLYMLFSNSKQDLIDRLNIGDNTTDNVGPLYKI